MTTSETTSTDAAFTSVATGGRGAYQGPRLLWLTGLVLIVAYIVQIVADVPPMIDEATRTSLTFRTVSGTALLLLLSAQLYVPFLRFNKRFSDAAKNVALHEALGVVGLILLYVHAPRPGHGYLSILAALLLANSALGLMSSNKRKSHNRNWSCRVADRTHRELNVFGRVGDLPRWARAVLRIADPATQAARRSGLWCVYERL